MKWMKITLALLVMLPLWAFGQMLINDFEAIPDSTYWSVYQGDGTAAPVTYLNFALESANVHGGAGALQISWKNRCYDQYGGWIGMTHIHPDSTEAYDFSPYTHISLWYNVKQKQSKPGKVEFRIILLDGGAGTNWDNDSYEVWISHHLILDKEPGWHKLTVALIDSGDNAASWMAGAGRSFWNPKWGQSAEGNGILDLNKIRGWTLEFSQDGSLWQLPDDTVEGMLLIDDYMVEGAAPLNLVLFNGKSVPSSVAMYVGWSGSAEVTNEVDFETGTNSIKWITGSGWDGVNFQFDQVKNMINNWDKDSLQFKIKAEAGLGDLTLIFQDKDEDGAVKVDYPFMATYPLKESDMKYDGTWKSVKVALKDFNRFNGVWDNDLGQSVPGEFIITRLEKFLITGTGQAFEGRTVYLDNIWTGSPEFDWIPPDVVTGVAGSPAQYYNLIIWQDVPKEFGETYSVYFSSKPIISLDDPEVKMLKGGILEETQVAVHWLTYPLVDKEVTWYYAVACLDASGNQGPFLASPAIVNTAQGVPTISLNPPSAFVADGSLDEWENSGIMPWEFDVNNGKIGLGEIKDEADLTAKVWLAMDDENLYVACDVIDNVFAYSTEGNWWNWDAFEFFVGFYDLRGPEHTSIKRGAEPDYKLVFLQNKLMNDFNGGATIYTSDDPNYHFEELGGADYIIEAKIPFSKIAFGTDILFKPKRGMQLPFDLYFHDNDGSGHEGNLAWSQNNTDLGWGDPRQWTFTWIGDTTHVTSVKNLPQSTVPQSFELAQNYPNPFNPITAINFTVPKSGHVKIEVFNRVGQRVATLVDETKQAGMYQVTFDADQLPSGVYFYRMSAGSFAKTQKMILMK